MEQDISRNSARELAVQMVYRYGFSDEPVGEFVESCLTEEEFTRLSPEDRLFEQVPGERQGAYLRQVVTGVIGHYAELTADIEKYAVGWQFSRISRVAVAAMCVALYEILYLPEIPNPTAINEAVKLTKKYDSPEAGAFVNGILGSFVRKELVQ